MVSNVTAGSGPRGAACYSGIGEVFVTNHDGNTVSIISDAAITVPEFGLAELILVFTPMVALTSCAVALKLRKLKR